MTKPTVNAIHIENGALDESPVKNGAVVLRGVVAPSSLKHLRLDTYQREALPLSRLTDIIEAVKSGVTLPDIELGMRGDRVSGKQDEFILRDFVYIIDGQQRVNACLSVLSQNPNAPVRLGALIHMNTDFSFERDRFRTLNNKRAKVAPSVLIRNERDRSPAVGSLYGLCNNDKSFVLHHRVCWAQSMHRGDLITGLMLMKVVGRLHAHKSPGRGTNNLTDLIRQADKLYSSVGAMSVRENIKMFFDVIDTCWGIKLVQYREMAAYLRGTFLQTLASVLSNHHDFWRNEEKRLFVDADWRRKLSQFPLTDPNVAGLTSAGGKASDMLYNLIVQHLNSGKKTHHLRPRKPPPCVAPKPNQENGDNHDPDEAAA